MKTLIVCESWHHGNTKKIADVMAAVLHAEVIRRDDVNIEALADFDLIGFGSGIYGGRHDRKLITLIENMPPMDKNVFIFSTYGIYMKSYHNLIKKKLAEKSCKVIGEFSCPGLDTNGPLRFIGGIAKGRPNEQDLQHAEEFAKTLRAPFNQHDYF